MGRSPGFAFVNLLCIVAGIGLLLLLGVVRTRGEFRRQVFLAYPLGLSIVGVAASTFATVGVRADVPRLVLFTAVLLALGVLKLARNSEWQLEQTSLLDERAERLGNAAAVTAVGLIVVAALWAMVRPLSDWDAWAFWWPRALALLRWGTAANPMITGSAYPHPTYPLLLPSLDALDFRAGGTPSVAVFHLQAVAFTLAFAGGYWALLARQTSRTHVGVTMLAIVVAPALFIHMMSGYADIPLALLMSLAIVSLVMWLIDGETWRLGVASVFLAAAALTKNEGQLFAIAAVLSAGLLTRPCGRQPLRLLLPVAAIGAAVAPWRFFLHVHHLTESDFRLVDLVSLDVFRGHWHRALPTISSLASASSVIRWAVLPFLVLIAMSAAMLRHDLRIPAFMLTWATLSIAALIDVYVVSPLPLKWYLATSADRVIATVVVVCASLTPVLLTVSLIRADSEREPEPEPEPSR